MVVIFVIRPIANVEPYQGLAPMAACFGHSVDLDSGMTGPTSEYRGTVASAVSGLRPLALGLLLKGVTFLASCASPSYSSSLPAPSSEGKALASRVLEASNRTRQSNGLPALKFNPALAKAAGDQARFLVANVPPGGQMSKSVAHSNFGGRSVAVMMANSMSSTSEIVAAMPRGQGESSNIISAWLASPGHRGKLLGPWTFGGAGAAKASDGIWFVVEWFGNPRG